MCDEATSTCTPCPEEGYAPQTSTLQTSRAPSQFPTEVDRSPLAPTVALPVVDAIVDAVDNAIPAALMDGVAMQPEVEGGQIALGQQSRLQTTTAANTKLETTVVLSWACGLIAMAMVGAIVAKRRHILAPTQHTPTAGTSMDAL
jgi:hypothetical protein